MKALLGLVVLALAASPVSCTYKNGAVALAPQVHVIDKIFELENDAMTLRYNIKFPSTTDYVTLLMKDQTPYKELKGDHDCGPPEEEPLWNITLHAYLDQCYNNGYETVCDGWEYIEWETDYPQQKFMLARCEYPYLYGVSYELSDEDFPWVSHASPRASLSVLTLAFASLLVYLGPW